jgi:hypothetical protein
MILTANREAKTLPSIAADLYINSEANSKQNLSSVTAQISSDKRLPFYMTELNSKLRRSLRFK